MILHLTKYLRRSLLKLTPRVYHGHSAKNAIFPYVVFNFPTSNQLETDREDIILEIDIWDYSKNGYDAFENVEMLTNAIDSFLRKNRHLDENQLLIFAKVNRLALRDPDGNVERRQLRYTVKTYQRNQE